MNQRIASSRHLTLAALVGMDTLRQNTNDKRLSATLSACTKTYRRVTRSPRFRVYLSFLLLGISSIIDVAAGIIFLALIPLLSYLPHMYKYSAKTVRRDFYWASFITCGCSYLFIFQMAPQNWTTVLTGWPGLASRTLAWVLVSFICAFSFWVVGIVLYKIKTLKYQIILLPFIWVAGDILRTSIFAVVTYGPGGSLSPTFNLGSLAVAASGTPLVFGSRLVGFYGLVILVVTINIGIFYLIQKKYLHSLVLAGIVAGITITGWTQGLNQQSNTISVSIVHLNEKDDLKLWDDIPWPESETDLLVLPEYSDFFENKDRNSIASRLSSEGLGITTVSSGVSPNSVNQVTYFNKNAAPVSVHDKTFLVPTGEFIPYSLQAGLWMLALDRVIDEFQGTQQLKKGEKAELPYSNGHISVGALACSGVNALSEYERMTQDGADILVNSASLSFLTTKSLYHVHARNMARFQAVSNNRPFVQASRSGESYILDNQGAVVVYHKGEGTALLETKIKY